MLLLKMISLSFNCNYSIKICVRLYNYIYIFYCAERLYTADIIIAYCQIPILKSDLLFMMGRVAQSYSD